MVDTMEGVLGIEWIEGKSVRFLLGGGAENEEEFIGDEIEVQEMDDEDEVQEDPLSDFKVSHGTLIPLELRQC